MSRSGLVSPTRATFLAALVVAGSLLPDSTASGQFASRTWPAGGATNLGRTLDRPAASPTGRLWIHAEIGLSITPSVQPVAAEAPDGTVFVARLSTGAPVPTAVWVVRGDDAPEVAQRAPGGVDALAADAKNFYIATSRTVRAFSRSTGKRVGTWALPAFSAANPSGEELVSMRAFKGVDLVMLPRGHGQAVYRIDAGSSAAPRLVAQGSSAAFGPNGSIYFVPPDRNLTKLTANGVATVGPPLADAPNGLGGGIQYVTAVAGGLVWVSEPAGQGLDTGYSAYDAKSLARLGGPYPGSTDEQIVDTAVGLLALSYQAGNCPQPSAPLSTACVFRMSSAGALSDPTPVGSAYELVGPDPAVLTTNSADTAVELDRLAPGRPVRPAKPARPAKPVQPANPARPAQVLPCSAAELAVSPGEAFLALGHVGLALLFRNIGAATCSLFGYPGVAALDAKGGQVVQAARTPSGYLGGLATGRTTPPTVVLRSGQTAAALVEGDQDPQGTARSCPSYPALLVTPPDTKTSFNVSTATMGGMPGCTPILVHPVVAGTSGQGG